MEYIENSEEEYNEQDDDYINVDEVKLDCQNRFDEQVRQIWDNVLVKYIDDIYNKELLHKLTIYDYNSFHRFMLNNSNVSEFLY